MEGLIDGEPEGSMEGMKEGAPEGLIDGEPEGSMEGVREGAPEGTVEGETLGFVDTDGEADFSDGLWEGSAEGMALGVLEGELLGNALGLVEGELLGLLEGELLGDSLPGLGLLEGELLGPAEGDLLGELDGLAIGDLLGELDGLELGMLDANSITLRESIQLPSSDGGSTIGGSRPAFSTRRLKYKSEAETRLTSSISTMIATDVIAFRLISQRSNQSDCRKGLPPSRLTFLKIVLGSMAILAGIRRSLAPVSRNTQNGRLGN